MNEGPEIARARAEAEAARHRLLSTASALQERLKPATLARDAWEGAKAKGADLAEEAVDVVKARPLAATGVAAAIALFLAREPVIEMTSRMFDGIGQKRAEKKRRKAQSKTQKSVEKKNDTASRQ